jgi:hypothetical protein
MYIRKCPKYIFALLIFIFIYLNRHLLGEDLGPLSVKELQQLEKQLECSLSQARQRKVQIYSTPILPIRFNF